MSVTISNYASQRDHGQKLCALLGCAQCESREGDVFNTFPGSTTALLKELYPEVDTTYTCEHCNQECIEPSGGEINECCVCVNQDRPKRAGHSYCELCEQRRTK